jgi:hypothetical protein
MRKIGAAVCAAAMTFAVASASAQTVQPDAQEQKPRASGEQQRPLPSKDEPESASHDAERPKPGETPPAGTTGQSTDNPSKPPAEKK